MEINHNFQIIHTGFDMDEEPMSALFKKYKLDSHVQDFVGHALALFQVKRKKKKTFLKILIFSLLFRILKG